MSPKKSRLIIKSVPKVVIPYSHLSKRRHPKYDTPTVSTEEIKTSSSSTSPLRSLEAPGEALEAADAWAVDNGEAQDENPSHGFLELNLPSSPPPPVCSSQPSSLLVREPSPSTSILKGSSADFSSEPPSPISRSTLTFGHTQPTNDPTPSVRTLTSEPAPVLTSDWIESNVQAGRPKPAAKTADIRSFFASATAPRARDSQLVISSSPGTTVRRTSPFSDASPEPGPGRKKSAKTAKKRPMTQLVLDLSNRPTTQICKECGMSWVLGVEEDVELHRKHHKQIVGGLEWNVDSDPNSGCRVVWRDESTVDEERIVKVPLDSQSLRKAKYKNKVHQILDMVNTSLGAQELSPDQLQASALYLYIGDPGSSGLSKPSSKKQKLNSASSKGRKKKAVVKAVCVAARIEHAYQIVRGSSFESDEQAKRDATSEGSRVTDRLLRFGEDASELYCSPQPHKALIGIHRIWTAPAHRRTGLAARLLDSVARTFIYSMPINKEEDRRRLVAFSQPTESGRHLATRWFGSVLFSLFIDL